MTIIESILEDIQNGEPPEKCLAELEGVVERLTGPLPDNRDDMSAWTNSTCALFYLMRYVFLARYYPEGHTRVDLLHKAAGLLPSGALDAPRNDEAIQHVDVEA